MYFVLQLPNTITDKDDDIYTSGLTWPGNKSTASMTTQVPLLDEQDFNLPEFLLPLPEQNIDAANNFCWYFHSSQFFEGASNNNAILNVHRDDPATNWVIHDRKEFNERLRSIPTGLQFVVAAEPQGEGQPWLYQRQNKVRDGEGKVETFVEGNWFNQGTRIMMAPSLLDVVRARLVSSPFRPTVRLHYDDACKLGKIQS